MGSREAKLKRFGLFCLLVAWMPTLGFFGYTMKCFSASGKTWSISEPARLFFDVVFFFDLAREDRL